MAEAAEEEFKTCNLDFKGDDFGNLLKKLESFIQKAGGAVKSVEELVAVIISAALRYDAERFAASHFAQNEISNVLPQMNEVIEALVDPQNRFLLFVALDEKSVIGLSAAQIRLDALVNDLRKIYLRLPKKSAPKRGRHREDHLRMFVGHLANYWVVMTGGTFTQDWEKQEPISAAAQFVHAILKFVHPEKLPSLPYVAKWVVKVRLQGKTPGWFNEETQKIAFEK